MFGQLAEAGFVVAANDYRFSGEALFPAAIEDTTDAFTWLRANADRFGIDASRVVLFGQSAGGYLAAAVGLDPTIPPVQGIACWYPLTDFSVIADDDPAADFPSAWLGAPLSTRARPGGRVARAPPRPRRCAARAAAARHRRHDGARTSRACCCATRWPRPAPGSSSTPSTAPSTSSAAPTTPPSAAVFARLIAFARSCTV